MIEIILITIGIISLAINYYFFWYRNIKVAEFLKSVINMCYEYNMRHLSEESNFWINDKYSYSQMLFSFKPLELSAWFTKEEIERLQK